MCIALCVCVALHAFEYGILYTLMYPHASSYPPSTFFPPPPVNPHLCLPRCLSPRHCVESVVEVIVCVGVLVVSRTYQTAASLALYLIAPLATILVRFLFAKGRCSRGMLSVDLTISKDRVEMFTDGVMAIAATIIILDVEAPKGAIRMRWG